MPRIGAEPERRRKLIHAAINAIGETGSLDVSVKKIATDAGMSSALAFHYFGGKDEIVAETMRYLLGELTRNLKALLHQEITPRERLDAIVDASFSSDQFKRKTIAAWLVFYVHAYSSPMAARLLNIYTRRLESNLIFALNQLPSTGLEPRSAAETIAAMIDGVFIRQALRKNGPDRHEAISLCKSQISALLREVK